MTAPPFAEPSARAVNAEPDPVPGSLDELRAFAELQRRLEPMFRRVFPDPSAPRTVIVIPSMSLDHEELAKLTGATYYEERFLCLLLLLRLPATRVVYVTSQPVAPAIVDYYLRLVRGVDHRDAWSRLTMLACNDASSVPLTEKILAQPGLVARIRCLIDDPAFAHLTCFTATSLERTLAVRLGIPLYGTDPALGYLGTKSGSRDVFHRAGVLTPPGFEHLRGEEEVVRALAELKRGHPWLRRAVIKLEEGFSGEGNAIFSFDGAPSGGGPALDQWVGDMLPIRARFVSPDATWDTYRDELARMGAIVEAFVSGHEVRSPSVQCRIDPSGATQIISTHDQVLGGASGQVYLGCTFPAEVSCCPGLHEAARRVTETLASDGVVGRFGIDFVSTRLHNEWTHHAIEINLRKGGTTHPFLMLALLTAGGYDSTTGLFHTDAGRRCYYVASDNLCDPAYARLTADRIIAAADRAQIAYVAERERGVVFHMLGALSEFGKLGVVCIGATRNEAHALMSEVVALLRREAAPNVTPPVLRFAHGSDHGSYVAAG
jgi:hypothetical protein